MNKKETLLSLISMLIGDDDGAKADPIQSTEEKQMIGEYVIVRCVNAGVHAGTLTSYQGQEVVLSNSRRLWYWKCLKGHSLSGVADSGIDGEVSKIPATIKSIVLADACEILSVTDSAKQTIVGAAIHESN